MEKPIYPSKNMRITQGYNEGSHLYSYAIDEAGADTSVEAIYAPFTGIIKKVYQNDANEVWLESSDKVEYPDGTIDYMTILFAHANDVSNLFVGKRISQNEVFYSEGTKGNATGNHCHIECAKGKFTGSGWTKNKAGYWSINNGKKPEECLWINNDTKVIDNHNYNFKKIEVEILEDTPPKTEPPKAEITPPQIEPPSENKAPQTNTEQETQPKPSTEASTPQLIFTCPKTDLYGIYLKKGEKLYLKK